MTNTRASLDPKTRQRIEREVYRKTHRDYKGKVNGKPSIMWLDKGETVLGPISTMPEDVLLDKARLMKIDVSAASRLTLAERVHHINAASEKGLEKLIKDAEAAGYEIVRNKGGSERGSIEILRRHRGTGKVLQGIVIWPDGTANDASVRLDLSYSLRTLKSMRKVLGLP